MKYDKILKAHEISASKSYQQIPRNLGTCRTPLPRKANDLLNQHKLKTNLLHSLETIYKDGEQKPESLLPFP
jgi:hypothetical protein